MSKKQKHQLNHDYPSMEVLYFAKCEKCGGTGKYFSSARMYTPSWLWRKEKCQCGGDMILHWTIVKDEQAEVMEEAER